MSLTVEETQAVIEKFGRTKTDSGSSEVQVALLTSRIKGLMPHFADNKKDHHSRRGLITLVNKRRKLLAYLKNTNVESYKKLIAELGLRR